MKNYLKVTVIAVAAMILSACSSMDVQERRMATGAIAGAATGYVISDGDRAATIGGAALGGLAGHQYDKHQKRQDSRRDYQRKRQNHNRYGYYGYR